MKTSAEKSSTTTSTTATHSSSQPFFAKAGGGDFFAPAVQMKMAVSKPGDKHEQEADRMADKVMRMPSPVSPSPAKEEKLQRAPDEKLQKKEEEKIQKAVAPEEKVQKKEDEKLQKAEENVQKKEDEKLQKAPASEEKLQRKGSDGAPSVNANLQSAIQSRSGGGQPLSSDVRGYMEPRFNADFSNVRIHSNQESASLSNQLSARAFTHQNNIFFSRDQYQPGSSEGKQLLAHELTHTIQQGHSVQRTPQVSTTATPPIQRFLGIDIPDVLDISGFIADKARRIPGFTMLTVVIGLNPITGKSVDRSAGNMLKGALEMIPVAGPAITDALNNHGVFSKVSTWAAPQFDTLKAIGTSLWQDVKSFIKNLSLRDLGDAWERGKAIITNPIARIKAFAVALKDDIVTFVKDAILKPIAAFAKANAPNGYDLLCAVLGKDPISGEPVPQTAENLIAPFMKLIGQEEVWENMKKSNAIGRAWAWFQKALGTVKGFVQELPALFMNAFKALEVIDIVLIPRAFSKLVGVFGGFAGRFISWAGTAVWNLLEIIFDVVAPHVMPYIKKAQATFNTILKDPVGFVGNLVRAGKLGFQMFAGNIVKHLQTALIKWITGPLGKAGVYIPTSFNLLEIIKLVLSVLGLTWQNIRSKLVTIIPEPVLVVVEKSAGILLTLANEGPAAAWEQIKAELSELKDQLISKVTEMVRTEIVKAAVTKLASMLNPAGAVIQAIVAIYNTITFFVQKTQEIAAVVASFIDSVSEIASGQVGNAATKVEETMAKTLNVVIAFLAKFAGLGNIPEKIVGIVNKIRAPIDKGLDKIVAWLGIMLKKAKAAISEWWKERLEFSNENGEVHTLFFKGDGDNARIMIASNENPVEVFLDDFADKNSKDYKTARTVFDKAKTVIFSPAKKSEDERLKRSKIQKELSKVSVAFAKLSGDPPEKKKDYEDVKLNYSAIPPAINSVEYLSGKPKGGSSPEKQGLDSKTSGWKKIYNAGLTHISDRWAQMHVISEKLGGKGIPENLIPAPGSINTGFFRSFEHSVKKLAEGKTASISNVVWVTVTVVTDGEFAKSISGESGLYFWKGKKASPKWMKNKHATLSASASIPSYKLYLSNKYSLNFSSRTDLQKAGLSASLSRLIKENRSYDSKGHFIDKISDKAKIGKSALDKESARDIVNNKKIILDD